MQDVGYVLNQTIARAILPTRATAGGRSAWGSSTLAGMALALFASFTPIDAGFQLNVMSVLGVVGVIAGLWAVFRRRPPVDVDLVRLHTSIQSLEKAVDALTIAHKRHEAHENKLAELDSKLRHLESLRESDAHTQRSYMAKTTREIFDRIESESRVTQDKLDTLTHTVAENMQRVERGLGNVEGAMNIFRDHFKVSAKP